MKLSAAISFDKLIWFIMADWPIDPMARYKIVDSLMIAYGAFKKLSVIIHSPVGSVNRPVRTPTMGGVGPGGWLPD